MAAHTIVSANAIGQTILWKETLIVWEAISLSLDWGFNLYNLKLIKIFPPPFTGTRRYCPHVDNTPWKVLQLPQRSSLTHAAPLNVAIQSIEQGVHNQQYRLWFSMDGSLFCDKGLYGHTDAMSIPHYLKNLTLAQRSSGHLYGEQPDVSPFLDRFVRNAWQCNIL